MISYTHSHQLRRPPTLRRRKPQQHEPPTKSKKKNERKNDLCPLLESGLKKKAYGAMHKTGIIGSSMVKQRHILD